MCKGKNCFTCSAYKTTQTFKDETFDPGNSSIVKFWVELKASEGYSDLTRDQKLAKLAISMVDKSSQRKALSKLGATRLSRNDAIRFLAGQDP
eukprot:6747226-Heterocapsa_arctica.AAC.1